MAVIDAGQIWKHKHGNQPVEVLGASDGLVVFLRGDRKQEWPVARFMVWYQYSHDAPRQEPEAKSEPRRPLRDQLWYSQAKGESCLIKDANPVCVAYQYATSDLTEFSDVADFVKTHEFFRESPIEWESSKKAGPCYDPNAVAFTQPPTAEQMIRAASDRVMRGIQARKTAAMIRNSTASNGNRMGYESIRSTIERAMLACEEEAQRLRLVLEELHEQA
jgi:hypothetical protein